MTPTLRDPLSAWKYLLSHGGIELQGRDEGLDQAILQRLDPLADSLGEALERATMSAFIRAFFESGMHPFVAMSRAILSFFERANATTGKQQWVLQVDDIDMELSQFQDWIETFEHLGVAEIQVPVIDFHGAWDLRRVLNSNEEVAATWKPPHEPVEFSLPIDVQKWLQAFQRGEYWPLPKSLMPAFCPDYLRPTASIVQAALSRITETKLNRERLMQLYRTRRQRMNNTDALDFWTLLQNETDFWLWSMVIALAAASKLLHSKEKERIGRALDAITSAVPMRPFNVEISVTELESVLSLPIWQKRHELYSVWVATEIVGALEGHQIVIHHEDGKIAFAFRETLVATIPSSEELFKVIGERRSPLQNPQGKGRSAAVQPDYGLWALENGNEVCRMIVEVKHYKKAARSSFLDVFEDYANAFPQGDIYLVNHGPTGSAVYDVSRANARRCHAIEWLTPSGLDARKKFAEAVRNCVGDPVAIQSRTGDVIRGTVLAVDVSSSMKTALHSTEAQVLISRLFEQERPQELVAINSHIAGSWPPDMAGWAELIKSCSGMTELGNPVRELLKHTSRVIMVTDPDGLGTLSGIEMDPYAAAGCMPSGLQVVLCIDGGA